MSPVVYHDYVKHSINIITCRIEYRRGLDGWMDLLTTLQHDVDLQVINSAIANLHTLQITAGNTKSSPACSVFTGRFLVTASNIFIFRA
jgi:hypothetical protein